MPSFWKSNRASKSSFFSDQLQHPGESCAVTSDRPESPSHPIASPSPSPYPSPSSGGKPRGAVTQASKQDTDTGYTTIRSPSAARLQLPSDALPTDHLCQRAPECYREYVLTPQASSSAPSLNRPPRPPFPRFPPDHSGRTQHLRRAQLLLLRGLRRLALCWCCWSRSLFDRSSTRRDTARGQRQHKPGL